MNDVNIVIRTGSSGCRMSIGIICYAARNLTGLVGVYEVDAIAGSDGASESGSKEGGDLHVD
jgi:hypothetical protein